VSSSKTLDYADILNLVRRWPSAKRLNLVQEILGTVSSDLETTTTGSSNTLSQALGLLTKDRPAPSDQQVREWLAEYRLEKYG
jgi:hypothetical protein